MALLLKKPKEFLCPWLILCEGYDDKCFFDQLIRAHSIGNGKFDVSFPTRGEGDGGGRDKFGIWLTEVYDGSPSFRENVKAVLVVSDNDDDRADSWKKVTASLQKAEQFGIPTAERQATSSAERPTLVILMIPIDEDGNLETLCIKAAYSKWDFKEALDTYIDATPSSKWRLSQQSKTRIHALLAATCEPKPETSFAYHWQVKSDFHIPVTDVAFNSIVKFLKEFEALLDAAPVPAPVVRAKKGRRA